MYISVRECHLPPLFGSIKSGLSAMGLDAVELEYFTDRTVYALDAEGGAKVSIADQSALEAYARKREELGIKVSALLLNNDFGAENLDDEIDWVISAVRATAKLGGNAMRIDAKMIEGTLEERTDHFAECMNRIIDATGDLDVAMGIENHGQLGNDPEFLDLVTDKVRSPRLGVTIDTANFYWSGYPVSRVREIIAHLAPKVKHTHVKNINYPADKRDIQREVGWEYETYASPLREGDIDMRWLVKTLKAAGYKGDLCIEDESLGRFDTEKQRAVLIDDANYLKEILKELG